MARSLFGVQYQVSEWSFTSTKSYRDPFNEIELDIEFTGPGGRMLVPAFWSGEGEWRVRFSPPTPGTYRFRTICSDTANEGLHGKTGQFIAKAGAKDDNPLYAHGPVRVSSNRRHLEHSDGTPFLWLADTWWMSLCSRLGWPGDFQRLVADRKAKGFNVVLTVAGLYPDMPAFDPRGANEAGFPWEKGFKSINPAYFDMADLRIEWLVRSGIVPCVAACWAYFLPWMGIERIKKHWRYLVARWGAYPVVWCLAGETTMPYYKSKTPELDVATLRAGWTEVAHYVRRIDPWRHPMTTHSSCGRASRDELSDTGLIDLDLSQAGHGGRGSLATAIRLVTSQRERKPHMPTISGEANYEGILHETQDEMQRLAFWGCMLSGAAGHTYGANGMWQVNLPGRPYGPSPHGGNWGNLPWEDAMRLPGSTQLGLGRKFLERYDWSRFEPHPEWVIPHASDGECFKPYAAGIPGEVRVIYCYSPNVPWAKAPIVQRIEKSRRYRAFCFDPRTGESHPLGPVQPDRKGTWTIPYAPTMQDWVFVLERARRPAASTRRSRKTR